MRLFRLSSVGLLALIGASLLCRDSASQPLAGQQSRDLAASKQRFASNHLVLVEGKRKAIPPTKSTLAKSQIGDMTILARHIDGDASGMVHVVGPDTEIEVPDKASGSILYVHADDIRASRVGASNIGLIILDGSVRYRLVQKTARGERILEGTAGHAVVRRTTKRMELTGGVRANLTDAARFNGPATLRTGSLIVATDSQPYRFTLGGAAASNDIQFTPLQSVPPTTAGTAATSTPLGAVHIYGFRSGDLQFGEAIHLQGAGTTCEFVSPDDKTTWRLHGEQFEGEFVSQTSDLQRATVTANARFHMTQPSADKKSQTIADGTASRASYVRSQAGQELMAHGPLKITFTDPEHFEEPATVTGEQSSVLSVKKSGDSLVYSLDDLNHTGKVQIHPKPLDASEPKPAVPPVPK